jgi:hypothetical protein
LRVWNGGSTVSVYWLSLPLSGRDSYLGRSKRTDLDRSLFNPCIAKAGCPS